MALESYQLGLTGYPLDHSLSPMLHRQALHFHGLTGDYRLYSIPPAPEGRPALAGLLSRLRTGSLHGLNVTIPHKQVVIDFLDELTPVARRIGAVNTIFLRDGRLVGDNTDAPGFLSDLQRFLEGFDPTEGEGPRQALVLGAGGAARAVAYALVTSGWKVTLAARRLEQAQEAAVWLGEAWIKPALLQPAALIELAPLALIVNATPLGMVPDVLENPWPAGVPLPRLASVYDLVYNPLQTALVRTALESGLRATTGLGMLVDQAALSFEHWTGKPAPRLQMRQAAAQTVGGVVR